MLNVSRYHLRSQRLEFRIVPTCLRYIDQPYSVLGFTHVRLVVILRSLSVFQFYRCRPLQHHLPTLLA